MFDFSAFKKQVSRGRGTIVFSPVSVDERVQLPLLLQGHTPTLSFTLFAADRIVEIPLEFASFALPAMLPCVWAARQGLSMNQVPDGEDQELPTQCSPLRVYSCGCYEGGCGEIHRERCQQMHVDLID